ncbi:MAG: hydantoinase/oxoprolinase N-terminal domain-containing protein [Myxococcota bacterium]
MDRGGTFTDVVTIDAEGRATLRKIPSDRAVVGDLAVPGDIVTLGTTVATNALLERRGVPTLLVVSEGLGDLVRIRDMTRPALFDPDAVWPPPLATRVVEVPGRLAADGTELAPLVLPERWPLDGIEAVAVVLLHAPWNPAHERAVADAIRAPPRRCAWCWATPSRPRWACSRASTPPWSRPRSRPCWRRRWRDRVRPGWMAIRAAACARPRRSAPPTAVLSGPATGVLAVAAVSGRRASPGAVGLDMGGEHRRVPRRHRPGAPARAWSR